MKLSDWYKQYIIVQIAEGETRPIIDDLIHEIGHLQIFEVQQAMIHEYIAHIDFIHYNALRNFVSWLDKQQTKKEHLHPSGLVLNKREWIYLYDQFEKSTSRIPWLPLCQ
jgi:hypothetical protein